MSIRARVILALGAVLLLAGANAATFVWANARRDAALHRVFRGEPGRAAAAAAELVAVDRVTTRIGVAVFAASLALAVTVAITLLVQLSRGLAGLKHGARVLGRGDLAYRIPEVARDELGDLARAFNEMADRLVVTRAELEEARTAAEAASAAKSAFLARMSHELRTPLNAIIGYSEMLLEDAEADGEPARAADLAKIRRSGKHLLALINEVLDLARVEAGKVLLHVESFAVAPLLREVAATIAPLARENGNTVRVDAGDELGTMRADPTRLRQVLFNLLGNACKFTRDGVVTVSGRRVAGDAGEQLVLTVADTGVGMTAAQLAALFREFEQGDPAVERAYGGSGLGLAISRRLCRLMGGDLTAESEPGRGATFTAVLPADAATAAPTA